MIRVAAQEMYGTLLDHPDELTLGLAAPVHEFLRFVKLDSPAPGHLQQVRFGQRIERRILF